MSARGAAGSLAAASSPPPDFGGYWSFVVMMVLIAFIAFLAAKNRLGVWLAFFTLTPSASPGTVTAPSAAGAATGQVLSQGAASLGPQAAGAANALGNVTGSLVVNGINQLNTVKSWLGIK